MKKIIDFKESNKNDDKKQYLFDRIDDAIISRFTGNISFEINFSQGGIRTIKYRMEELKKF